MFKILITYLAGLLQASKLVEKIVFAQLVRVYNKESKETYIAPFEPSENNYLPINWDEFKGVLYIRKKGDITSSDTLLKEKACNNRIFTYSVPLRIVVGVIDKKECFLGDGYAERVVSIISGNNSQLKTSLKARTVNVKLVSYSTDSEKIAIEEYSNNPRFNYDLSLVAVDIRIEVVSNHNLDCIDPCPPVDFDFPPPASFCERVLACVDLNPPIVTCEQIENCGFIQQIKDDITALQDCCGEQLTCEVDITFSSESEATDQGWVLGDGGPGNGTIADGKFCSGLDGFGLVFAQYQDGVEYTIKFDIIDWIPIGEGGPLYVDFWGVDQIEITEAGVYEFKRTGNLGQGVIIMGTTNVTVCFDNFRVCTVDAPPAGLTCETLETCQIIQDLQASTATNSNAIDQERDQRQLADDGIISDIGSINLALIDINNNVDAVTLNLNNHVADTSNPHAVTKAQVGLSNVDNTSDATKNSASATLTNKTISGASNTLSNIPQIAVTNLITDLSGKQATLVSGTNIKTINGSSLLGAGDLPISGGASNPFYRSGNIITNIADGCVPTAVTASGGIAANTINFYPFLSDSSANIDQAIYQFASGAVNHIIGFWTANSINRPDVNLAQTASAATGAAGMKILSLSTPIAPKTLYYISVLASGALNLMKATSGTPILGIGANLGSFIQLYTAAFTFGVMPADTSGLTLTESTGASAVVAVRVV